MSRGEKGASIDEEREGRRAPWDKRKVEETRQMS